MKVSIFANVQMQQSNELEDIRVDRGPVRIAWKLHIRKGGLVDSLVCRHDFDFYRVD